jgi:hypothetical protein
VLGRAEGWRRFVIHGASSRARPALPSWSAALGLLLVRLACTPLAGCICTPADCEELCQHECGFDRPRCEEQCVQACDARRARWEVRP